MKQTKALCSILVLASVALLIFCATFLRGTAVAQDADADVDAGTELVMVEASGVYSADGVDAVDAVTKNYIATTDFIVNPERGMLSQIEVYASDQNYYHEFDLANLQERFTDPALGTERKSLVLCLFYLDSFAGTDTITLGFQQVITDAFKNIRTAGLKCVLRFAYTAKQTRPYGDVDEDRMFKHLAILEPIIRNHADVILLMQMGQIGTWGEAYYTDYYGSEPDTLDVNSPFYAKRFRLLNRMLQLLPVTRTVMIRTPYQKQNMFGVTLPLTSGLAFSAASAARSGHFNDCFLADSTDSGTYSSTQIVAEKNYLAEETKYVPMGGETCANNTTYVTCNNAQAELARFHWTFLKKEWHAGAIAALSSCLPTIKNKLGYRLELVTAVFPNSVRPGGAFALNIKLQNSGYAAPVNPRPVELILRRVSASAPTMTYTLKVDPRKWLPGTQYAITDTISIPCNLPLGQYELLLNLPDSNLRGRSAYSIRLANKVNTVDVWEAATGYNKLDFTLPITHPTGVLAQYCQDFRWPMPMANWRYLWNASSVLSPTTSYTPLIWDGVSVYDVDGIPGFSTSDNLGYGYLRAGVGHPGFGVENEQPFDRYVIAAYTVTVAGSYVITNSRITDSDKNGGNGAQVCIFTNRTKIIQCLTYDNGGAAIFNRSVGSLSPNDVIYVAVGPRGNAAYDAFSWDFSIGRSTTATATDVNEDEVLVSVFLPIITAGE